MILIIKTNALKNNKEEEMATTNIYRAIARVDETPK
jgi:hypothetical protein